MTKSILIVFIAVFNFGRMIRADDLFIAENPAPGICINRIECITSDSIREIPFENIDPICFPRRNQAIRIEFAVRDHAGNDPGHGVSYLLARQGQKGIWLDIGDQRCLAFSNLQPGWYRFMLRISDPVINPAAGNIRMNFILPASDWRSPKAVMLYIIGALLTTFFLFWYGTRNLRKANKMLRERQIAARGIAHQKEMLILRNKKVTDSINYARRIQRAMLPSPEYLRKIVPNSFVLNKPRDIVSGDFYWVHQRGDKTYVAAVDCTGHGVPGAFISVLGFEFFRRITSSGVAEKPGQVLNELNRNFREIFKSGQDVTMKDGMDLALCLFYKGKNHMDFAGAFNPLYIIRDNNLIEIKADRFSVGADHILSEQASFTNHRVELVRNDILYVFSDGYVDQFGGPEGKKFKHRRFRHLLLTIHQLPLDKQMAFLDESIRDWQGDYDQVDDILVIGIKPEW